MPDYYRPSSGMEGMAFEDRFCDRCEANREFWERYQQDDVRGELMCPINRKAYEGQVEQWVYDENGEPMCTEFKEDHS